MNNNFIKIYILITLSLIMLLIYVLQKNNNLNKIIFSSDSNKYWVGEKYNIMINNNYYNMIDNGFTIKSSNNNVELIKGTILIKKMGKECLNFNRRKNIFIKCFNIYNSPKIKIIENTPIKIDIFEKKQLNLDIKDYPLSYIKFKSKHLDIIDIDNKGIITAKRPGNTIITITTLDNTNFNIEAVATANKGLINKFILDKYQIKKYSNIMIVAHPDDEVLWGGANLYKDSYFVVCLTNGYNKERANDFKKILNFTNNSGIILNYPDTNDNIVDNWKECELGIIKDLSQIINFKNWSKIVTYGPDGTTGHKHHKKVNAYVTQITRKFNKYDNLYYFGKFYKKNQIPNYLPKINYRELEYKKREIDIYKSVKNVIYRLWYHMLPYENWIKASSLKY